MKWNSIRTKVLAALASCLVLGVGGILALLQYSFTRNSQALASDSVAGAQKLFQVLETRETSKMAAVSETLMIDPQVRDAFAAKDRSHLLDITAPLYTKLKAEGITNWMFHTPEPDMAVFLRLHNAPKFGDRLNRFMDKEVVRTHAMVTGNELAKAGFAVRILPAVLRFEGQVVRLRGVRRRDWPLHQGDEESDRRRLRTLAQQEVRGPSVLGRFKRGMEAPR